jgi:cytoskeleton-associated protein 5
VLLVQTFYQYIGSAIEPWLAEMKPVQIKELKESFEAMDAEGKGKGSLKPARVTREHARELEARGEENADADAPGDVEQEGECSVFSLISA